MRLTTEDSEQLRAALSVCRIAQIDAVVITDGQIRGISPTAKLAIISPIQLSVDTKFKIGLGRLSEFEKRLSVFAGVVEIAGKTNANDEAIVLELKSGRSSIQYRCTAEKLIKYPKANSDEAICCIELTKAELQQLAKAVKTLAAEQLTLAIDREGGIRFECSSATNEVFITDIQATAQFEGEPQPIVHLYEGDKFATVLEAVAREYESASFILGEFGSLTLTLRGHTLVVLPEANQENDDE